MLQSVTPALADTAGLRITKSAPARTRPEDGRKFCVLSLPCPCRAFFCFLWLVSRVLWLYMLKAWATVFQGLAARRFAALKVYFNIHSTNQLNSAVCGFVERCEACV